ncbi:MAG: sensor domain-containing diguanylate cyclase [Pirellulaceae bacterium]
MEILSQPFPDFHTASRAVLRFLHDRLGFGLWMVTRTERNDWIVLQAADHHYGVKDGDVFQWMDSYCSRMVNGLGPRIAPRSGDVPAYAAAPIGQQVPIAAYIGVPLVRPNGALFGTLCAIDPEPKPQEIEREQPLIELLANLLSKVLETELVVEREARRAEQADMASMTDSLTGLYNRRGWERLLRAEEERCQRFGHPAAVFSIDVDGLKMINDTQGHASGDQHLVTIAHTLRKAARVSDVVARLGGDEFAILSMECETTGAQAMKRRISKMLATASCRASLGFAVRSPNMNLEESFQVADKLMYREKNERRNRAMGVPELTTPPVPTGMDPV